MPKLNRRDFLKIVGVSSAASGCDVLDKFGNKGPRVPMENVLPYVVTPDQIVPGLSTWFSSQCNECGAGCGVIARNREGRIVKLEGNPDHPTNRGKICSVGSQGIQATYSPDRFMGPMVAGAIGGWDAAIAKVTEGWATAKSGSKTAAWLGRPHTGSLDALLGEFAAASGLRRVHWDPLGAESLRAASRIVFGRDAVPTFHPAGAQTVVSFGANFLTSWLSPVSHTRGLADSRDPATNGLVSRFVSIEPRIGSSNATADIHLSPTPGTEAGVALALAYMVMGKGRYNGPAIEILTKVDVNALVAQSGLDKTRLDELAGWLARGSSIVFPGGETTSSAPTDLATAVLILNEVCGNIGTTVQYGVEHNVASQGTYRDVVGLLADCAAGNVGLLILEDLDLAYLAPSDIDVAAALAKVATVVVLTNEPNDTLPSNAIVMPMGTTLENWGDNEAIRGRYTLQQPAMKALYDTKSLGDIVLALAAKMGLSAPPPAAAAVPAAAPAAPADAAGAQAPVEASPGPTDPTYEEMHAPPVIGLGKATYREYLTSWWEAVVWPQASTSFANFQAFWTASLQLGGYFASRPVQRPRFQLKAAPGTAPSGPQGDGLVLALFPHPFVLDGRHANRPWAHEVPDPLTGFVWSTWAEIHPDTAAKLGFDPEQMVTVKTEKGSIDVSWFASPGIRPDTVAVVMGSGQTNGGRYTKWGANPFKLLSSAIDEGSGARKLVTSHATLSRSEKDRPVRPWGAGNIDQDGRPINFVVHTDQYNNKGEAHAKGPGELIHHEGPEMDPRIKAGGPEARDMFPEPEHPTYRFAMALDLNRCTGCGACQTACYSENNISVVGPEQAQKSRVMSWIRLSRYWEGSGENPDVRFQPVMCQQCSHAPCEGVCPVLATYHNQDGLNAMIYNRCVGTRYCGNNCPYSARRFNYHTFDWPEPFHMMLNPDVTVREMGVMEKCTFCIQRIRSEKDAWRDTHQVVPDTSLRRLTACAQACPADAITFGNAKDSESEVSKKFADPRAYAMLSELNTKPGVRYLARIVHTPSPAGEAGEHAGGHNAPSAAGEEGVRP